MVPLLLFCSVNDMCRSSTSALPRLSARDSPIFADTRLSGESDGKLILTELRSSGVSCACKASSAAAQSTVIRLFHLLNIYGVDRHVAVGPVYETSSYGPLR